MTVTVARFRDGCPTRWAYPPSSSLTMRSRIRSRCYSCLPPRFDAAGWIRTSTCAVLETAASAVGLLRRPSSPSPLPGRERML